MSRPTDCPFESKGQLARINQSPADWSGNFRRGTSCCLVGLSTSGLISPSRSPHVHVFRRIAPLLAFSLGLDSILSLSLSLVLHLLLSLSSGHLSILSVSSLCPPLPPAYMVSLHTLGFSECGLEGGTHGGRVSQRDSIRIGQSGPQLPCCSLEQYFECVIEAVRRSIVY